jgi:hypothetical protein
MSFYIEPTDRIRLISQTQWFINFFDLFVIYKDSKIWLICLGGIVLLEYHKSFKNNKIAIFRYGFRWLSIISDSIFWYASKYQRNIESWNIPSSYKLMVECVSTCTGDQHLFTNEPLCHLTNTNGRME